MSYGLRVRDSGGGVILDTANKITRLRWLLEVASGVSNNTTLADISGLSSVEISMQIGIVWNEAPHLISRSGTTITWTANNGVLYNSADSLLFAFLYT